MNCSMPSRSVPHHLPQFAQVRVHCIGDAIQPSHPLPPSSPSALNISQYQGLIFWYLFRQGPRWVCIYSVDFWNHAKIKHCFFIPYVINSFLSQSSVVPHVPLYIILHNRPVHYFVLPQRIGMWRMEIFYLMLVSATLAPQKFLHWLPKISMVPITKIFLVLIFLDLFLHCTDWLLRVSWNLQEATFS